jgi:hypothetical protein
MFPQQRDNVGRPREEPSQKKKVRERLDHVGELIPEDLDVEE